MTNRIDWLAGYSPQDLSPGLSALSSAMDALAERRAREAQLKQQREMELARQAEQAKHDRELEAQARAVNETNKAKLKQDQAKEEHDRNEKAAGIFKGDVMGAVGKNDVAGAMAAGAPYGIRGREVTPEAWSGDAPLPAGALDPENLKNYRPDVEWDVPGMQAPVRYGPAQAAEAARAAALARVEALAPASDFLAERSAKYGKQAAGLATTAAAVGEKDPLGVALTDLRSREGQDRMDSRAAQQRAAAASKPPNPHQEAMEKHGWVTAFETSYKNFEASKNVDKLKDAYDQSQTLLANMENYKKDPQANPIEIRSALYQVARAITGPGVLTAQEYGNTVQGTGGVISAALSKLQKGLDGTISDAEAAALERFVANAHKTLRNKAIGAVKNYDTSYGPKTSIAQAIPEDVAAKRSALMDSFGLTEYDLNPKKAAADSADRARAALEAAKARGASR